MTRPFVSVLIDTYNHERFIEQTIASVREQDFPAADLEIVVVDDGSTDRTADVARKFEPEVRLIQKANGGQASAFNAGVPECKGELVAFLDGDDWWAREKLTRVVEALTQDATVGLAGHGITEVFSDGREHTELLRENPRVRILTSEGARLFRLRKSFLGTSRMTFRRSVLLEIGAVPEALRIEADEYLFTVGASLRDALILREPLTFYRLHESNLFQVQDGNLQAIRRKQEVLEVLANSLQRKLKELNVPNEATQIVVESIQTEADLIRLSLENGAPWETVSVELRNYGMMHETASLTQWLFKWCALIPACLLPSRRYYELRSRFARNGFYKKAREKWLPFPEPTHVDRYRSTRL